MKKTLLWERVEKEFARIEGENGKYIRRCVVRGDGSLDEVEQYRIGKLDDFVIIVHDDGTVRLARQVRRLSFAEISEEVIPENGREDFRRWILACLSVQGGDPSKPGIYPVRLAMLANHAQHLDIVPEMEMWDEDDEDEF